MFSCVIGVVLNINCNDKHQWWLAMLPQQQGFWEVKFGFDFLLKNWNLKNLLPMLSDLNLSNHFDFNF